MKKQRVISFTDEINDEFSKAKIIPKTIGADYVYDRDTFFGRLAHLFWYRLIATPLAFLYLKISFAHRVVGRKKLRPFRTGGIMLYGNHTQDIADALIPSFLDPVRTTCVIVHPNNVSMPFLGKITPYMGAIPLPDERSAYRGFLAVIQKRLAQKCNLVIYPEAHIWPYYTGIRPFGDASFSYPIKYRVPVFCFTNTYRRRRFCKKPRIVTYIDGPFFPDLTLAPAHRRQDLRERVYQAMCARAARSEVEYVKYLKKE